MSLLKNAMHISAQAPPPPVYEDIFPDGYMQTLASAMAMVEEQNLTMGQIVAADDSDEDVVVPIVQMGLEDMVDMTEPKRKKTWRVQIWSGVH